MDRIITRWKSAIQYSFSAAVAGDQIIGAFQLHSVAKERLKVRISFSKKTSDSSQPHVAPTSQI